MKIISLKMKNFRQFYGEQEINFSTDKDKNITLIHAENGVGKTALLNAIKWCLFGETTPNFKDPDILLNLSAKKEKASIVFVEITFEEDQKIYVCRRTLKERNVLAFQVWENSRNGHIGSYPINDTELFINTIIPKDMSQYFFFQGEGIGKITSAGSTGNQKVKDAIHKILGFTTAKQALKDLNEIKAEYSRELGKADNSAEVSELSQQISALQDSMHKANSRLDSCIENIAMCDSKIKEIDEQLLSFDSAVIKQLHQERKNLEAKKISLEKNRIAKIERKKDIIGSYASYIFANKLASAALDFIDEEEFKGTIPAPYNENLVRKILEEKNCICGAEIHASTAAYHNIKKLLANAADPDQGHRVTRARETLRSIQTKNKDAKAILLENINDINSLDEQIEKNNARLAEISLKLNSSQIESVHNLETTRSRHKQNRDAENQQQGRLIEKLASDKRSLAEVLNKLNKFDALFEGVKTYQELLDVIRQVEDLLYKTLKDAEESVLKDLSSRINRLLEKYVTQDYRAAVDKDTYDIRLLDRNGHKVAESDGQQLLLSLTFISCLIELAAQRKGASGEILTPGAIAPFIIDAPFGVLDNKYKGNMAHTIPDLVEQVVFLLSSSHWQGSVENNIRAKVGAEYNLVLEVKASQGLRELSPLIINDRKYDTVRYDCDVDQTVIEEIKA